QLITASAALVLAGLQRRNQHALVHGDALRGTCGPAGQTLEHVARHGRAMWSGADSLQPGYQRDLQGRYAADADAEAPCVGRRRDDTLVRPVLLVADDCLQSLRGEIFA